MADITYFGGEYRWLSNFAPSVVQLDGVKYPTIEHAYQAAKTLDKEERLRVQAEVSPNGAKAQGYRLTLRKDWEQVKLSVMCDLLLQKFHIDEYAQKLMATGDVLLIEGNTWHDTYWGVCEGKGFNHLGQLLMMIREHLREEYY